MMDNNEFDKIVSALTDTLTKIATLPDYPKTDQEREAERTLKQELMAAAFPLVINVAHNLNDIAFAMNEIAMNTRQR
jgi:glycyl-tRNA synthetase alpha subunit